MRKSLLFLALLAVLTALLAVPSAAGSIVYQNEISLEREVALTEEDDRWQGLDADWAAWRDASGEALRRTAAIYDGMTLYDHSVYSAEECFAAVDFAAACDLDAHATLSLLCQAETAAGRGSYYLDITLISGTDMLRSEVALPANSWCRVMLDIGGWAQRSALDRVELRLVHEGEPGSVRLLFAHLEVDLPMREGMRTRFLSDRYHARGGTLYMTEGAEVAYFVPQENSPILEAQTLVPRLQTETNALRLVFDNETACERLTLYYAYRTDGGDARSVSLTVGEGRQICLFEIPDAGRVRYLRLVFTGAKEGLITLHALNAVSVYDSGITPQGSITECRLDEEGRNILIRGTVAHDVMIANRQNRLALFAVAPWEDVETVLRDGREPVAEADISIRFSFSVPFSEGDYGALCADYLVAIKTGEEYSLYTPIADPHSLTVPAAQTVRSTSGAAKGVQTSLVSTAEQTGVSVYLIDVYLDLLSDGTPTGFLYACGGQNYYFDRTALDRLDHEVKVRSAAGAKVYLRFLISDAHVPIDYALDPETATPGSVRGIYLSSARAQNQIGAISEFLSARYLPGSANGSIAGIIVGKQVDDAAAYNEIGVRSLSDYVDHYASLLTLVANSARRQNPALDVVVPISDRRTAVCLTAALVEDSYDSELFLRSLFKRIDDFGGMTLSLMLESEHNPFSLDAAAMHNDGEAEEEESDTQREPDYYNADRLGDFSALLDGMSATYASMPGSFIYCWTPTDETGDALSAAYAYLYYCLRFSTHAETFIVSFARAEAEGNDGGMAALRHLMKYIDTDRSLEVSEMALSVFDVSDWGVLIRDFDADKLAVRKYAEGELSLDGGEPLGTYTYWDFSSSYSTRGWYAGTHTGTIAVKGSGEARALTAVLSRDSAAQGEYSEMIYRFSPAEPLGVFDRVAFTLMLDAAQGSVWEICVYTGGEQLRIEQKQVVRAGCRVVLYLSPSALEESGVAYLKLCVKPVSGNGEGKLCLYSVRGESDTRSAEALAARLSSLRSTAGDSTGTAAQVNLAVMFSVCAVVIFSIAVAVLLGRRQERMN